MAGVAGELPPAGQRVNRGPVPLAVAGHRGTKALLDGTTTNAVGAKAAIQWSFGKKVTVLDDFEKASSPPSSSRTLVGTSVSDMASVTIDGRKVDERTNQQTDVLVLAPNVPDPPPEAYKLKQPASHWDWTGFDQFTFRVCADTDVSTAAKVDASALPDFTLVFTDTAGGSTLVTASSQRMPNRPCARSSIRLSNRCSFEETRKPRPRKSRTARGHPAGDPRRRSR